MGPIVVLAGVLVFIYGIAAMFAGAGVASATRRKTHSRTYGIVTAAIGACVVVAGLVLIGL